jgi:isopenicillin N synthase-like dioxygenase
MSNDTTSWFIAAVVTTFAAIVIQKNKKSSDQVVAKNKVVTPTIEETARLCGTYLEYLHALDILGANHTAKQRTPEYYYGYHTRPRDWRHSVQELHDRIGYLEEQVQQMLPYETNSKHHDEHDNSSNGLCFDVPNQNPAVENASLRPLVESHYEDLATFCAVRADTVQL